jgi:hypothetical protein
MRLRQGRVVNASHQCYPTAAHGEGQLGTGTKVSGRRLHSGSTHRCGFQFYSIGALQVQRSLADGDTEGGGLLNREGLLSRESG